MQTFGAGNAPEHPECLAKIREASTKGVIVVNVTQCQKGEVEAHYAAGSSLVEAGVISAGDMTPEAALVKLGWLIGSGHTAEKIRELFTQNLRGEITVHESRKNPFTFESDGFAKAVFEVLRERNQLDVSNGSNAIDNINVAILPTLVCHFASKGSVSELASMYDSSSETKGRKISPDIADYDGRTGLHLACANNRPETAKFFIEDLHADVNFKDNFGRTALYEAVESKADDELITYLISRVQS